MQHEPQHGQKKKATLRLRNAPESKRLFINITKGTTQSFFCTRTIWTGTFLTGLFLLFEQRRNQEPSMMLKTLCLQPRLTAGKLTESLFTWLTWWKCHTAKKPKGTLSARARVRWVFHRASLICTAECTLFILLSINVMLWFDRKVNKVLPNWPFPSLPVKVLTCLCIK